jgi:hypothetical protein
MFSSLFCVCSLGRQCLHSELPDVHPVGATVCFSGCLSGASICALRLWLWYTRGELWLSTLEQRNNDKNSKYFCSAAMLSTEPSLRGREVKHRQV